MMTSNRDRRQQWLERLEGAAQTRQLGRRTAPQQDTHMSDLPSPFVSRLRHLRPPRNLAESLGMDAAPERLPPTLASSDLNIDLDQDDDDRSEPAQIDCSIQLDRLVYDVPVSSDKIWRFHGSSIYVAPAEELLSPAMRQKWSDFILTFQPNFTRVKDEMIAEQCKSKQLRKKGCNLTNFILEVRISGRRETPLSRSIKMGPCLWILCGSKWCQKRVREVAQLLTLPVDLSLQRIQVHTGFPIPNALETMIPMSQLLSNKTISWGLDHLGGHILYHLEGQELASGQFSACGLLCCATYVKDDKVVKQHVSRIGGLFTIDKDSHQIEGGDVAITTAHGVFDYLWSLDDLEENEEDQDDEDEDMEDEEFSSGSESSGSGRNEAPTGSEKNSSLVGEKHASEVQLWLPLKVYAVKYLNRQFPKGSLDNEDISAPADYAILASRVLRVFENVVDSRSGTTVTGHTKNEDLDEGPVLLLLGSENNSEAKLLPGSLKLSMGDSEITVRKVRMKAALAPGTSGTWLVRDSKFCGMIIAAYPGEPLALFMTAEDILESIQITFPGVIDTNATSGTHPERQDEESKSVQHPRASSSGSDFSIKIENEPDDRPIKLEVLDDAIATNPEPDQNISRSDASDLVQQDAFSWTSTGTNPFNEDKGRRFLVWTCCQCGDSGMSYSIASSCPNCHIYRCANCPIFELDDPRE